MQQVKDTMEPPVCPQCQTRRWVIMWRAETFKTLWLCLRDSREIVTENKEAGICQK